MLELSVFTVLTVFSAAQEPERPPLVVHEWGTFTSMQGSDGFVLEGLQWEEERLPAFVHAPAKLAEIPSGGRKQALKFPASRVTQKMETPVIYFHTDVPQRVTVDVLFLKGLLTQFYPLPQSVAPELPKLQQLLAERPLDLSQFKHSSLRWEVDLIPYGQTPPRGIPEVDEDDLWAEARQVRSAYVRTTHEERAEAEHYLFYRGLGRYQVPVSVQARRGDRATFHNGCEKAVPFALALEIGDRGGRFRKLGAIDPDTTVELGLGEVRFDEDLDAVAGALGAVVHNGLVERGLFVDEARAMVATWSRSWFRTPGHRVIYIAPEERVTQILPLIIQPLPTKVVRVLVGRQEFITPEREDAVDTALRQRVARDETERAAGLRALSELDRFLEPHLRRAARSEDETVRNSAADALTQLASPAKR